MKIRKIDKDKRILLADNDPNDRELSLLAFADYNLTDQVVIAKNGEEVLDYLYKRGKFADRQDGNPLAIFLDLKMPKVNGDEVLEKVKADPELSMIPIVMLSSSGQDQDILNCYRQHANAYVEKPFEFQDYIDLVKQLIAFWVLTNSPPNYW